MKTPRRGNIDKTRSIKWTEGCETIILGTVQARVAWQSRSKHICIGRWIIFKGCTHKTVASSDNSAGKDSRPRFEQSTTKLYFPSASCTYFCWHWKVWRENPNKLNIKITIKRISIFRIPRFCCWDLKRRYRVCCDESWDRCCLMLWVRLDRVQLQIDILQRIAMWNLQRIRRVSHAAPKCEQIWNQVGITQIRCTFKHRGSFEWSKLCFENQTVDRWRWESKIAFQMRNLWIALCVLPFNSTQFNSTVYWLTSTENNRLTNVTGVKQSPGIR